MCTILDSLKIDTLVVVVARVVVVVIVVVVQMFVDLCISWESYCSHGHVMGLGNTPVSQPNVRHCYNLIFDASSIIDIAHSDIPSHIHSNIPNDFVVVQLHMLLSPLQSQAGHHHNSQNLKITHSSSPPRIQHDRVNPVLRCQYLLYDRLFHRGFQRDTYLQSSMVFAR